MIHARVSESEPCSGKGSVEKTISTPPPLTARISSSVPSISSSLTGPRIRFMGWVERRWGARAPRMMPLGSCACVCGMRGDGGWSAEHVQYILFYIIIHLRVRIKKNFFFLPFRSTPCRRSDSPQDSRAVVVIFRRILHKGPSVDVTHIGPALTEYGCVCWGGVGQSLKGAFGLS